MALALASASSQYLRTTTLPASVMPLTLAIWWKPVATGGSYPIVGMSDAAGNNSFGIETASGAPRAYQFTGGAGASALHASTVSTNWQHVAAVFAGATSRSIYLDGTGKVTNATSVADPATMAAFVVGKYEFTTLYANGSVAELAVWTVALDDDEIAALAKGMSPALIRPQSQAGYWELFGNNSPEQDRSRNANSLTLTNGPTKADHPRIYYPSRAKIFVAAAAGAASFAADVAAAAVLVASLSVGAGLSAAATGTATTSAALTTGVSLRADVTAAATTTAALRVGAGLRADVIGSASTSATFAALIPVGRASVELGGVAWRTRVGSVGVRDLLNAAPNTCSFTVEHAAPSAGQEVRITLGNGTVTPALIFAGSVVNVEQFYYYDGPTPTRAWKVSCQDFTRTINRRKVRKRYAQQSATPIALDLAATYTTGFTTGGIVAGLPTVTGGIDFTEEDVLTCFTRLAARIGGYSDVDYTKVIKLFLTEASEAPDPLVPGSFLDDPAITWSADHSQLRTRVIVEGGGAQARTAVAIGATSIPVTDASWYSGTGGIVVSGPQRITYTGKGLVGGPAAPSAAQSLVAGNLGSGPYTYKVSQIAAGIESNLSAASASVTIDPVPNPTTAIAAADIAFAAPASGPAAGTPTGGGGVDDGAHEYAVTFVSASGETPPGPRSSPVTTSHITPPSSIGTASVTNSTGGPLTENKDYRYKYTFINGALETTPSPSSNTIHSDHTHQQAKLTDSGVQSPPAGYSLQFYRTVGDGSVWKKMTGPANGFDSHAGGYYWDEIAIDDASLGADAPTTNSAGSNTVPVSSIPTGPSGTTARNLWRTTAASPTGALKFVGTISGNGATTYSDTTADASLGGAPPSTNTAGGSLGVGTYGWKIVYKSAAGTTFGNTAATASISTGGAALSSITTSADARVTARDVYRTTIGGSTYLYEGTIPNNTATTFTSTIADGALGSAIPTSNTTAAGKMNVTGIATGGGTVTARKLYRTPSGGSTYKLVATIGNNTDTTLLDNIADASLGVVAPGDTQSELTGIPASGPGSVLYEILISDDVNILEQCDDVAAQTALAALEGGDSDGVSEHFIQDHRLASAEARATGFADLALFSRPIVAVRYATRDPKTRSGKTIHVDVPELGLLGDFTINSVTIDQIDISPGLWPRYVVEASSVRFSFEDVLRRLQLVA